MEIKAQRNCPALTANDGCRIFELLHPANDGLDLPYSFAIAELKGYSASYRHRLEQTEVYYVIEGRGLMHIDDDSAEIAAGEAVVIPARAVQWIENLEASMLRFVAIVSPPWRADGDERL